MAAPLDFSDLTGKKKTVTPQQTNTQGFQTPPPQPQQNQQLGVKILKQVKWNQLWVIL